ncbi:F-box protein At5g07610-like isoform X2 [Solanum dulcamara]|uniref:F-box protein At5g07610-like isoform X2 n=1 Tax=Solanum dulcamara TaxID=45834 RepID=UPI002485878F|nr:F-box protein At5g07610-like isoform X2 [Solanum dulcamara]
MACSDIDTMTDESLEDDIYSDSSDSYVAIKPQGGGINSLALYDLRTAASKEEGYNCSEFPADIIMRVDMKIKDVAKRHVLPFLPAKSLMKFRAVSKEWNQWIASPLLAYNQSFTFQKLSGYFYQRLGFQDDPPIFLSLHRSANGVPSPSLGFLPENVKVLSSSSGLLLCQGQDSYYVCNPATKDWKKLPPPQYYHGSDPAVVLAFDPQFNIESFYHVVAAVTVLDHPVVCFEIYCSESDSWKCSPSDCLELENTSLAGGGFYMEGVAYWRNTSSNEVIAFDVKNEIAAVLHVPIIQSEQRGALTQIGDEVCYVTAYNDSGNVFVIDIYGGVDMGLKRSVSVNLGSKKPRTQVSGIPMEECCEVLPCTDSETVVIHTDTTIYFYHLREQKVETLLSPGRVDTHNRFLPYINSLVMVHRSGE